MAFTDKRTEHWSWKGHWEWLVSKGEVTDEASARFGCGKTGLRVWVGLLCNARVVHCSIQWLGI